MAKVNISLPDDLLEQVDALAEQLQLSRSGLIQEASARYVTQALEERARTERAESIRWATAQARDLSRRIPAFDSTAAIRADRERDGRKIGEE